MDDFLSRRPTGVELNALSNSVFEVLVNHTAFPWPLLRTQAERVDADPANLDRPALERLIEPLAKGVARFNTPEAGHEVHLALKRLF